MKRFLLLWTLPLFASYSPFYEEEPPEEPCPFDYPRHLEGGYIRTGDADVQGASDQDIRYTVGEIKVGYLFPLARCTGALFGVGYTSTTFDWRNNPYFNQTHFEEVNITLAGFTKCVRCWLWKGSIGLYQQTQKINVGRYGMFEGFLWGRYDWMRNVGLNIGVIGLVGKRKALIRPIIGFDWCINRKWTLNAIYPVDMALIYHLRCNLHLSGAFRFERTRQRLSPVEPNPEGIFEYRSWGIEGKVTYEPLPNIKLDVYVGSTIYAWVKVNNRVDRRIVYRDLKPTGYVGAYAYAVF